MPTYSLVGKSRLKEVKTLFISPMKSGCPVLHRWKGVAPLLLSHPYLDISPDAMPEEPSLMFFAFSSPTPHPGTEPTLFFSTILHISPKVMTPLT